MYDIKKRVWMSDADSGEQLRLSRDPAYADNPEAQFIRASEQLSHLGLGGDTAEAVALMQTAAVGGCDRAMFAMGQMFEWGWGVHKNKKMALEWYRRAAASGYAPAAEIISKIRRRRIIAVVASLTALAAVLAVSVGVFIMLGGMAERIIILINPKTELTEASTVEEFTGELQELIAEYDDELVISGQVSTNRVILRFEGMVLDLRKFPADKVISRGRNVMVIQFSSEEEARRCISELAEKEGIVFAEMDEYSLSEESSIGDTGMLPSLKSTKPQNGVNSWGVLDMGLDKLSAYVGSHYSERSVTVAVIDGGVLAWSPGADEAFSRLLPGVNLGRGGDPVPERHGTHVAGTVLDGTRGANVYVLPIDIALNDKGTSTISVSVAAIDYAVAAGVDVINRSRDSAPSDAINDAIKRAVAAGVVFVNAAGNHTEQTAITIPEPIIVGAYDIDHKIASFSNYGESVDVCAPGVAISSFSEEGEGKLRSMDGTSMASPHVAALAALVKLIYPDATPAEVETYIKDYCRTYRNPDAYETGLYGEGAPDATAFIEPDFD